MINNFGRLTDKWYCRGVITPEPFLRWAGGKRQLVPILLASMPAGFDLNKQRFFEPFAGGAALTWALSNHSSSAGLVATARKKGRPIVINDVNEELAGTYRVVQNDVEALIVALGEMAKDVSETRYYEVRDSVPADFVEAAARTIYLNRLSFNGLYRVNSNGEFNVPYGKLANPLVCDRDRLRACAAWLAMVEIRSGSFTSAVNDAKAGDLVYLDPPYVPLTTTASFSKYAKDDFREMDQWALAGVIRGLIARGVKVMLSNSNTILTRQIFGKDLSLFAVSATRSISAAGASRVSVEEVLGISYPTSKAIVPSALRRLRKL